MFSRIGNLIYRSSESKNSASYVNRQSLNLTLDPSGTDFVEYSTNSAYFTDAHSLIPNSDSQTTTTALKLQDSSTPANNFFLSTLGDFTLCVKHKLNTSSTSSDLLSHYFTNPQYDISFTEPYIRENSPFNVIVSKASDDPIQYEVSGNLTAADLTNGDISGTLSTVESILPFTLNTGTGGNDFVFLLKNLDVSLNAPIYSQYYVTTSTNILGETVFAFSPTGTEGTYNNQLDLSFGANSKMVFDVSHDTMTDISLVFGTTIDNSTSVNESVVTRTNDLVILDISAGYTGGPLVYFEDTSSGMGYVSSSSGASGTAPQLLNSSFESNTLVGTGNTFGIYHDGSTTSINDWTTIGVASVYNRTFISKEGDPDMPMPTPFVDGSYCLGLGVGGSSDGSYFGHLQQAITLPVNNYNLSWYDVRRSTGGGYDQPNNTPPVRIKITKEADSTVIRTHEYSVTNTVWTEKTTSFSITEEASYIVSFETYVIDGNTGQAGFDKVTFSIAPPSINNYTVDVSNNSIFRLDSGDGNGFVDKLAVDFANNSGTTYIFDQSHASNTGNTLVIGTTFDDPTSIVSSGLTIMGTPGQPGAYTKYVSHDSTVHYFSYQTSNMGYNPTP